MQHLEQNDLLSNQQYGFISGRSTGLQLLNVMDEWESVLAEGGQIDVVYMDFQKAFDTVPHRRLLGKLESYGIRSKTKRWIASFLGDTRQRVMVNGTASEWRPVTSGIPQGSVLGPGLFVAYINDLPKNVTSGVRLFADDTKISRQIRKENDAREVQDDLHSLQGWSDMWLLKCHPQKCKFMSIRRKKIDHRYYMMVDNKKIYLDFRPHMEEICKKANRIMGVIRRTYSYLTEKEFCLLYKALGRPHLESNNVIWPPRYKKDVELEQVQRRATKQVPGLRDMEYSDILKHLKLPTLVFRRIRGDMIEIYKIINVYDPKVASQLIQLNKNKSTRGHSIKIRRDHANRDIRRNYLMQRAATMWSYLPEAVVTAKTTNTFKNRLDKY